MLLPLNISTTDLNPSSHYGTELVNRRNEGSLVTLTNRKTLRFLYPACTLILSYYYGLFITNRGCLSCRSPLLMPPDSILCTSSSLLSQFCSHNQDFETCLPRRAGARIVSRNEKETAFSKEQEEWEHRVDPWSTALIPFEISVYSEKLV